MQIDAESPDADEKKQACGSHFKDNALTLDESKKQLRAH